MTESETARPGAGLPEPYAPRALELVDQLVGRIELARVPTGFGYLDRSGSVLPDQPVATWITARMAYTAALASLASIESTGVEPTPPTPVEPVETMALLTHGVDALLVAETAQGWPDEFGTDGPAGAYGQAFVLLAATAAAAAGAPRADQLEERAWAATERHFDSNTGRYLDLVDDQGRPAEDYRGINANMHMVEALLTRWSHRGDPVALDRAFGLTDFFVHQIAAADTWRLPEHYTADWVPDWDHNRDHPAHPFRPYGQLPGHAFEWARLCRQLEHALVADDRPVPGWLVAAGVELFRNADRRSWGSTEVDGYPYSLDHEDRPVVRPRLHWVACEAMAAAWVLRDRLPDGDADWRRITEHLEQTFVREHGLWLHEVDDAGNPGDEVWAGAPDVYHAAQALLTVVTSDSASCLGGISADQPVPAQVDSTDGGAW